MEQESISVERDEGQRVKLKSVLQILKKLKYVKLKSAMRDNGVESVLQIFRFGGVNLWLHLERVLQTAWDDPLFSSDDIKHAFLLSMSSESRTSFH